MLKAEQVPDAVRVAAHNAWWQDNSTWADVAAAVINAWPGMRMMVDIDTGDDAAIKLPLPQEPRE